MGAMRAREAKYASRNAPTLLTRIRFLTSNEVLIATESAALTEY